MNSDQGESEPAITVMTMDILSQILSRSDNPKELGNYLAEEIRELTGARCVILMRGPDAPDKSGRTLLTVHPERRRAWAESLDVMEFFQAHAQDTVPCVWNSGEEPNHSDILDREGFHISFSIPLRTGDSQVGCLFALGLPDIIRLDSVIDLLRNLSTIVALVMRNASLYDFQEQIIEERTAEVQAAYEQIRSELEERIRIEEKLRESSQFKENIISNALVWIMVVDQYGSIALWNTAAEEISGYFSDEVVGKREIWKLLYPDTSYRREITRTIQHYISDKNYIENFETTIITRSGMKKIISWNTKELPDPFGKRKRYIAIGLDVTEQYQAEQKLQESEERFRLVFENLPIGLWLADANGTILAGNPAGQKIWGVEGGQELSGLKSWRLPSHDEILPDDRALVHAFQEGKVTEAEPLEIETLDGTKKYVLQWAAPIRSPDGKITGAFVINQDITQRKRDEEVIREKNAYLENLISIANVPIIIWDEVFRISRVNHACEQLIGREADEVIGKDLSILFPPEEAERSMRLLFTTREGVRWESARIDILHRDGSIRNVVWNSATLYSSDGSRPVATIAQGRDITDELRLEQEKMYVLSQIQRNLAQLAILNDEIRNPLTIILACAEMDMDPGITERIHEQVRRIDEIVLHLDQHWVQSEKVLNVIRKHYHMYVSPNGDDTYPADAYAHLSKIPDDKWKIPDNDLLFLEEIKAELYTILDSIDAVVYVADMDSYDLLYLNKRGRNLFGDIGGKKCFEIIYQNREPCAFCTNALLMDLHGPTGVYTWEIQHPGNGRWYDCRDRAVRWTDGRMVRLEIATDITDRKIAEKSHEESEKRYRTLFETANMGIFQTTPEGRVIMVNPAFARMFGFDSPDDVINRVKNVSTELFADPDRRDEIIQTFSEYPDRNEFENLYRRNDGSSFWGRLNIHQKKDSDSGLDYLEGFIEDITERKKAEEAVFEGEKRLAEVMRLASLVNWEFDVIQGIFTFNDPFYTLYGTTASREGGYQMAAETYVQTFVHPEDQQQVKNVIKESIEGSVPESQSLLEHRIIRRDGDLRYIIVRFRLIKDNNGRTIMTHGANQDITERRKAEEALRESNQKLRLLTGLTRHDIFNHVSAAHLILNLALTSSDPQKVQEYISHAIDAVDKIESTIGFTREYESFGTSSSGWHLICPMIESAKKEVNYDGINIPILIPDKLEVYADPIIRKVFTTLMENAIRHGGTVSYIQFTSIIERDSLILICEDDGTGIPPEKKEQIFEHGFGDHTGIGLFLAREILSITGLSIRESGIFGKGGRFEILVPAGKFRILA